MDIEYKGQHAIVFYKDIKSGYLKKNSWTNFHMIPASRPYVAFASPGISQVVIPGTSKRVDITDYRPGGLTFGARSGTWEFYIDHTRWPSWVDAETTIREYIHGGTFLVALKDDPKIAYKGILTISGYVAGQNYSKITIQYDLMNGAVTLEDEFIHGGVPQLPDPTYVDGGLDLDGDGKKDTELAETRGYDFNCDGVLDYITVPAGAGDSYEPQPYVYSWRYAIGSGVVEAVYVVSESENQKGEMWAIRDARGVYGFDIDCDGYVDIDLTRYFYVDVTDLDIKPSMLPPGTLSKERWQWITDGDIITGLDVTGDGKPDFDLILDGNNEFQLVQHRDPVTEKPTMDPSDPKPSQIDIPTDKLPEDAKPKDQWQWTRDENDKITGIDVTGDGKPDFDLIDNPEGGKNIVPHHDPINDDPISETEIAQPTPEQIDIPTDKLPEGTKPRDQWEWTTGGDGEKTGVDVTGDGKPDFDIQKKQDGTYDIVPHEEPITEEPVLDPSDPKPGDLPIKPGDLPPGALPKEQWQWVRDENDEITGVDVTGDGEADFDLRKRPDGTVEVVPHGSNEPVTEEPLPEPPKLPEFEDLKIPEKVVEGWDTDCDGNVDIPVDLSNPIQPKYIYDEETDKILGIDFDGDNEIDIYVTDHDSEHDVSEGLEGLDTDCDGKWNVQTFWPTDELVVFGDYYPLQFVFQNGSVSNQYGMTTVSKSGKTFGVYDVYTIYETDRVTYEEQPSGDDDEIDISQYEPDEENEITFID